MPGLKKNNATRDAPADRQSPIRQRYVHRLRSTVVTMTSKVNGKTGSLTPVDLKPLKMLLQKLDTLIKLRGENFMGIGLGVSAPQIAKI